MRMIMGFLAGGAVMLAGTALAQPLPRETVYTENLEGAPVRHFSGDEYAPQRAQWHGEMAAAGSEPGTVTTTQMAVPHIVGPVVRTGGVTMKLQPDAMVRPLPGRKDGAVPMEVQSSLTGHGVAVIRPADVPTVVRATGENPPPVVWRTRTVVTAPVRYERVTVAEAQQGEPVDGRGWYQAYQNCWH